MDAALCTALDLLTQAQLKPKLKLQASASPCRAYCLCVHMQPEEYQLKGEFCKYDDYNTNPEWGMCVTKMRQDLIAATCIAAMIATLGERLSREAFG